MDRRLVSVLGFLVVLLAGSVFVYAQANGTSRYIAYQGRLERGSSPVTDTARLRFGLFGAPNADASCLASGADASFAGTACGYWRNVYDVSVVSGVFSTSLGPIGDGVLGSRTLYVGVAVYDAEDASYHVLSGLHPLHPAASAHAGYDFEVFAQLNVAGNVWIEGDVGIGTASPAVALDIDEGELQVRASHNGTSPIASFFALNGTQGVGIGYNRISAIGANASQDLNLQPKGSGFIYLDGNTRFNAATRFYGAVTLDGGDLSLASGSTIRAKAMGKCDCESFGSHQLFTNNAWYTCPSNKFLTGIYSTGTSSNNCNDIWCLEQFECCRPCELEAQ